MIILPYREDAQMLEGQQEPPFDFEGYEDILGLLGFTTDEVSIVLTQGRQQDQQWEQTDNIFFEALQLPTIRLNVVHVSADERKLGSIFEGSDVVLLEGCGWHNVRLQMLRDILSGKIDKAAIPIKLQQIYAKAPKEQLRAILLLAEAQPTISMMDSPQGHYITFLDQVAHDLITNPGLLVDDFERSLNNMGKALEFFTFVYSLKIQYRISALKELLKELPEKYPELEDKVLNITFLLSTANPLFLDYLVGAGLNLEGLPNYAPPTTSAVTMLDRVVSSMLCGHTNNKGHAQAYVLAELAVLTSWPIYNLLLKQHGTDKATEAHVARKVWQMNLAYIRNKHAKAVEIAKQTNWQHQYYEYLHEHARLSYTFAKLLFGF